MSYAEWAVRWRVPLHFAIAGVVLTFAQPTPEGLLVGGLVVAAGVAGRGWAAGHLRKPHSPSSGITTTGPYAYLRHPLYLGSALILAGFAVAAGRAWLAGLLGAYYVFLFLPALKREEAALREQFPDQYQRYAAAVPALLPRVPAPPVRSSQPVRFALALYFANREWRGLLGCVLLLLLLYLRLQGLL